MLGRTRDAEHAKCILSGSVVEPYPTLTQASLSAWWPCGWGLSELPSDSYFTLHVLNLPHTHVGRAGDAVDCILRAGARRAFPTRGFAERLAARGWDLSEPPGEASEWVEELEAAVQGFRVRVAAAHGLSEAATAQAQPCPLCIS